MKENTNIQTQQTKTGENNFCPVDALVGLTPYYQDDYVTIYNCDSLTAMVALRPSAKDIIIVTDPPYGIGAYANGTMGGGVLAKQSTFDKTSWDNEKVPPIYFEMMKFISREQIIFGGNYYDLGGTKSYIVWDKDNGDNYFADCELAWTSFDKAVRKIKHKWQGMLQQNMKEKEEKYHPTQKPLAVMQWIIENYTTQADIIVDPFMGSGTTLAAAKSLGRKAIGMDINKAYCEVAVKRLQNVQIKLVM
jgi:site-specific DNA-methyltransferase (adenine-specific)